MNCVAFDPGAADFAIYLDYGSDCLFGRFGELSICERGMCFRSQWRFQVGTQLALQVCAKPANSQQQPVCVELTGLVVSCERRSGPGRGFEITLLFLNVPEAMQSKLDGLAARPELMTKPDCLAIE